MVLGRGDLSIADQLVEKHVVSDSFSLCYGGMDFGSSAMVFGRINPPSKMVLTHSYPLRSDVSQLSKSFPTVDMVFINGKNLSLTPENYLFKFDELMDQATL